MGVIRDGRAAARATPDMAIVASLPGQYKTTLLLENSEPVALRLRGMPQPSGGSAPRVIWRCDRGRLERTESSGENRFTPPPVSCVSTIEAELNVSAAKPGAAAPPAAKAILRVISPSPGRLLKNGVIDGFTLGEYLDPRAPGVSKDSYAAKHPDKFQPPRAFYLVDDASRDLPVSPHFKLGDFALDYPWFSLGKRQYIALDLGLLRKMEDLIAEFNRAGLPGDSIRIIYAFRPPAYNSSSIAKDGAESLKAPFSVHQYGKALDIILDADGDLQLDDLDGDGKVTVRDTIPMMRCVNALDRRYRSEKIPLYGGAGLYDHHDFWERPVQTPYVHVDVRGFLASDGTLIRWPAQWPDTKETIVWSKM